MEIHKAKIITDWDGRIYTPDILILLEVGLVVRISFVVEDHPFDVWSHDAPYLKIESIRRDQISGTVLDIKRYKTYEKYPVQVNEVINFKKENIIEIPSKYQTVGLPLSAYYTDEYVPVTGPLFTIEYDIEQDFDEEISDEDEPEPVSDSD